MFAEAQQSGLDLPFSQACTRIRWILSKKASILILSIIAIGAVIYGYLMQFKDLRLDAFFEDDEDDEEYI